jgi:hypothetical protein
MNSLSIPKEKHNEKTPCSPQVFLHLIIQAEFKQVPTYKAIAAIDGSGAPVGCNDVQILQVVCRSAALLSRLRAVEHLLLPFNHPLVHRAARGKLW